VAVADAGYFTLILASGTESVPLPIPRAPYYFFGRVCHRGEFIEQQQTGEQSPEGSQYSHRTGVNFCMLTMLNSKAKVSSLDSIWTASGAIISECTISRR